MEARWVLQFCHSHYGPFLDVARQYAVLFRGTPYKVLTVYLTGEDTPAARSGSASDEVLFLGQSKRDVRGLKLKAVRALRRILAARPVDLILAHRFKPLYVACLASKVPVIGVHHGFGDYARPARRWFARCFGRRLTLLGVSNAVRDDIRRCLPGWPAERIQTLYNRIDLPGVQAEQLDRAAARRFLALPADACIVGNVGRLHPDKDQATLIRGFALALPRLPPSARLAIMGSGPLAADLRRLAEDLGIGASIYFLGQIPDGRRYFKAFDLFALTSDREPFGMVLLEAMAAGVPCICSDCGGGPEVVADPDRLFPLRDANRLAQQLLDTLGGDAPAIAAHQTERIVRLFSDDAARATFRTIQRPGPK